MAVISLADYSRVAEDLYGKPSIKAAAAGYYTWSNAPGTIS